jgi:hypothetical protein
VIFGNYIEGQNQKLVSGVTMALDHSCLTGASEFGDDIEREAWVEGYRGGDKCGASDAELASVEIPGAHGMISGFEWEFLERFGFLKGFLDHDAPT